MTRRVAFVLPSFAGGGAERVLLSLLSRLDRSRFDLSLVVLDGKGPLAALAPPGIELHDLRTPRLRHAASSLVRTLRAIRPTAIVSTLGYVNLALLAIRPLRLRKAALILREANLPAHSLTTVPHPIAMRLGYRLLYPRAELVLCPARIIAESLRRDFGVPGERLTLLYNPVDETALREAASSPFREPGDGQRFVAAGRLTPQKGFDRLLDMMAATDAASRLTILGEGPELDGLRAQAQRLGLGARVAFAGFEPSPWPRYAGADAFLLPSRWEGMPNAALEALACGTPVIATPEAGGIGEIAALATPGAVTTAEGGAPFVELLRAVAPRPAAQRPSLLPAEFRIDAVVARFTDMLDRVLRERDAACAA